MIDFDGNFTRFVKQESKLNSFSINKTANEKFLTSSNLRGIFNKQDLKLFSKYFKLLGL